MIFKNALQKRSASSSSSSTTPPPSVNSLQDTTGSEHAPIIQNLGNSASSSNSLPQKSLRSTSSSSSSSSMSSSHKHSVNLNHPLPPDPPHISHGSSSHSHHSHSSFESSRQQAYESTYSQLDPNNSKSSSSSYNLNISHSSVSGSNSDLASINSSRSTLSNRNLNLPSHLASSRSHSSNSIADDSNHTPSRSASHNNLGVSSSSSKSSSKSKPAKLQLPSPDAIPPQVPPKDHPSDAAGLKLPKSMKRKNFKKLSLGSALSNSSMTPNYTVTTLTEAPAISISNGSTTAKTTVLELQSTNNVVLQAVPVNQGQYASPDSLIPQMTNLELGVEFQLNIRNEDLQDISSLGSGNGGTVSKALHIPTNRIMARKRIPIEANAEVRRRIVRELHIMHECNSPYIVSYYGAFVSDNDVVMCMEYMDVGSLDRISKKHGPLPEPIIGKITEAVVEGLVYLYDTHHIMHRDIKPSNVLVNSQGQIKLCDFGVSGELINSIANTFVGTSIYMSPERIRGGMYNVRSDVWSLGITLLELAIGYFPWENDRDEDGKTKQPMGILDLLQRIVKEPPPALPDDAPFSNHFRNFVNRCLSEESERPTPQELKNDAFFILSKKNNIRLDKWAQQL